MFWFLLVLKCICQSIIVANKRMFLQEHAGSWCWSDMLRSLLCKYCEVLEGLCTKPATTSPFLKRFSFKNQNQRAAALSKMLIRAFLLWLLIIKSGFKARSFHDHNSEVNFFLQFFPKGRQILLFVFNVGLCSNNQLLKNYNLKIFSGIPLQCHKVQLLCSHCPIPRAAFLSNNFKQFPSSQVTLQNTALFDFFLWKGIRVDNIWSICVMLAVQLCLFEGLIWEVKPLGDFSISIRIFTRRHLELLEVTQCQSISSGYKLVPN